MDTRDEHMGRGLRGAGACGREPAPADRPSETTIGPSVSANPRLHPLFPGRTFISTVLDVLDSKETMSTSMRAVYVQRAAMAGFFVGLFLTAYFAVMTACAQVGGAGPVAGRLLGPLVFGWALVLIYYTNSELLTSNMMVISIGVYHRRITLAHSARLLSYCLAGNLIGAAIIAVLLSLSTVASGVVADGMAAAAMAKIAYVATPAGALDLVVRAALCNFCINIAMLMVYNGKISDDLTKCLIMIVAVFVCAFCGFEHSIANSALFLIVGLHQGVDVIGACASVALTLVGNLLGGGVLIGLNFAIMNNEGHRDI